MTNFQRRDNLFTQDKEVQEEMRRIREVLTGYTQPGAITEVFIGDGAVGTEKLAVNSVTADKIASNVITAGHIAAGTITATEIASNAITADEIAANAVTADEIAANTITAAEIAANTITALEIASNTITANEIAANTITANEIASNAITADEIAANTITAGEIAANTITATEIASDAITADEIAAGTITANEIQSITIESGNVKIGATVSGSVQAGAITAGKLAADAIDAMTITGATLRTGSGTTRVEMTSAGIKALSAGVTTFNVDASTGKVTTLAGIGGPNRLFNSRADDISIAPWNTSNSTVTSSTNKSKSGTRSFRVEATGTGSAYLYEATTSSFSVIAGEQVTISGWVWGDVARNISIQARWSNATFSSSPTLGVSSTTGWQRYSYTFTVPVGVTGMGLGFIFNATAAGDVVYWTDLQLEDGELLTSYGPKPDEILPDTVTGTELAPITTNSTSGGTITVGGVAAGTIAAGTIAADRLVANSITATQIAAGAITATQLTVSGGGYNLAKNSSFEDATSNMPWTSNTAGGTAVRSTVQKRSGSASLLLTSNTASTLGTHTSNLAQAVRFPVTAGERYTVSGYVREAVAGATTRIRVIWYNAAGTTVTAHAGETEYSNTVTPDTTWQRMIRAGITAPATAESMRVLLYHNTNAIGAATYWDDIQVELGSVATPYSPNPEELLPGSITGTHIVNNTITTGHIAAGAITANELSATAIDGKTITGATIRTAVSGVPRVQITSAGLQMYGRMVEPTITKVTRNPGTTTLLTPIWQYFVITAYDSFGETMYMNYELIAKQKTEDTFTISWTADPRATGFRIYRGTHTGSIPPTKSRTDINEVLDLGTVAPFNGVYTTTHPGTSTGSIADTPKASNTTQQVTLDMTAERPSITGGQIIGASIKTSLGYPRVEIDSVGISVSDFNGNKITHIKSSGGAIDILADITPLVSEDRRIRWLNTDGSRTGSIFSWSYLEDDIPDPDQWNTGLSFITEAVNDQSIANAILGVSGDGYGAQVFSYTDGGNSRVGTTVWDPITLARTDRTIISSDGSSGFAQAAGGGLQNTGIVRIYGPFFPMFTIPAIAAGSVVDVVWNHNLNIPNGYYIPVGHFAGGGASDRLQSPSVQARSANSITLRFANNWSGATGICTYDGFIVACR